MVAVLGSQGWHDCSKAWDKKWQPFDRWRTDGAVGDPFPYVNPTRNGHTSQCVSLSTYDLTLSCAKHQLSYTYFTLIPGCHLTQANASVGQGANQRGERKYEHLEQRSPIALASRVATAIPTPAPLNRKKSMNRRTRVQLLNPNFQQHIKKWWLLDWW